MTSALAYARPTLVWYGTAVVVTKTNSDGSTFDGGNGLATRKFETRPSGILSQQNTDSVRDVSTTTNTLGASGYT